MLNFEKYKFEFDEILYPLQPKPPKEKEPELYRIYADQLEEWKKKKKKYDEQLKHMQNEQKKLYLQFKKDLFDDLGIVNSPKAEKLFEIAWSEGHASGYHEVYNYAVKLVELII